MDRSKVQERGSIAAVEIKTVLSEGGGGGGAERRGQRNKYKITETCQRASKVAHVCEEAINS